MAKKTTRKTKTETFTKGFVLPKAQAFEDDASHEQRLAATEAELVQRGLRATGKGRFVGSEDGGDSVALTYSIPVQSARLT